MGEAVGVKVGNCAVVTLGSETGKMVGVMVLTGILALWGEQEIRKMEKADKIAVLKKDFVFIAIPINRYV